MNDVQGKLSFAEKFSVLETSIDRKKVNKNSKFNKYFKDVALFYCDGHNHAVVISAELYTRNEATNLLYEFRKDEKLCYDYDDNTEIKECIDCKPAPVEFGFVKLGYHDDIGHRIWCGPEQKTTRYHNFHEPVYYIGI